LTVRLLATHQLVHRGGKDVVKAAQAVATASVSFQQRLHALWVLDRLRSVAPLPEGLLESLCKADVPNIRVHAMRVLAERMQLTEEHRKLVLKGLEDSSAHVRRAAADAAGRHPHRTFLRPLVTLIRITNPEDTHLRHVARMALRDQLLHAKAWPRSPEDLGPGDEPTVADVAVGVPDVESARFLLRYLTSSKDAPGDIAALAGHVARHGGDALLAPLVAAARAHRADDLGRQRTLLQAIERGVAQRGGQLNDDARDWAGSLVAKLLASNDTGHVQAGITLAGSLRLTAQRDRIARLLLDPRAGEGQQLAALDALVLLDAPASVPLLGKVLSGAARSFKVRQQAAAQLGRLNLPRARQLLVEQLQTAPASVQTILALALAGTTAGAEELLKTIEAGKASGRLLQDRTIAARVRESRPLRVDDRIAKLTAGLPSIEQRVEDLLKRRRDGFRRAGQDVALGAKVFEKNCANCHQVGGKGQRIGPQLDGIGVRGLERLLEDTIDPSRNVDQAFRTTVVNLKSGQSVRGLLLRGRAAT
jgi:hypothetical protein